MGRGSEVGSAALASVASNPITNRDEMDRMMRKLRVGG
jgi:hypothetical protein